MSTIEARLVSSMEKIFPGQSPRALMIPAGGFSVLREETFAFQCAYFPVLEEGRPYTHLDVALHVESDLAVSVRQVGYVPAELLYFYPQDRGYLPNPPGLFPDPLYPVREKSVRFMTGRWNALFLEINTSGAACGRHAVTITLTPAGDSAYEPVTLTLFITVSATSLVKEGLEYTDWFHADCLADYYHVPVFSEAHWTIMEKQLKMAADYGQTMVLTPLFTPPLDTAVGGERTTVQLVGVTVSASGTDTPFYTFDFSLLDRFIQMAQMTGITSFEMSHLFTQWGGKACPKVMAMVNGSQRQIFGWDTKALSPEYQAFLKAFLPALVQHLRDLHLENHVYFHLTDEPHSDHREQYQALKELVEPLLEDFPIMDAMSDYAFFSSGATKLPVVATTALDPFLTGIRPEKFWVYYCCGQGTNHLSNRFFSMPGARTRILGVQCYLENVVGFLHWGLNFYNSQYSLRHINPYQVTDADRSFPSGDSFILYPGEDGDPIPSQRLVLMLEAWQDFYALHMLEKKLGRNQVVSLIREMAGKYGKAVTFTEYPEEETFLLELKETVNRLLS